MYSFFFWGGGEGGKRAGRGKKCCVRVGGGRSALNWYIAHTRGGGEGRGTLNIYCAHRNGTEILPMCGHQRKDGRKNTAGSANVAKVFVGGRRRGASSDEILHLILLQEEENKPKKPSVSKHMPVFDVSKYILFGTAKVKNKPGFGHPSQYINTSAQRKSFSTTEGIAMKVCLLTRIPSLMTNTFTTVMVCPFIFESLNHIPPTNRPTWKPPGRKRPIKKLRICCR